MSDTWSTTAVARIADVSMRQLHHWSACGFIPGQDVDQGSGRPRRWTIEQIRHACALGQLTASGLGGCSGPVPNPHLAKTAVVLAEADWSEQCVLYRTDHLSLTLHLDSIDREVRDRAGLLVGVTS